MTGSTKRVTYRLKFEIPPAFVDILNDIAMSQIDVYWNETMVCRAAEIVGIAAKQEKVQGQSAGLIWMLTMEKERTPDDASYPSIQMEVNDSGDLRLHALQMSLPTGD